MYVLIKVRHVGEKLENKQSSLSTIPHNDDETL